jgi:hypothetical protein
MQLLWEAHKLCSYESLWDEAWNDPSVKKILYDPTKIEHWKKSLPMPKKFPATLKDFLRMIVKARTEADGIARLRHYFRHQATSRFRLLELLSAKSGVPLVKPIDPLFKPSTEEEATNAANASIQVIKQSDEGGGFFDQNKWIAIGGHYRDWWGEKKSVIASSSARKRKPTS